MSVMNEENYLSSPTTSSRRPHRTLPPDARIIPLEKQPQRYPLAQPLSTPARPLTPPLPGAGGSVIGRFMGELIGTILPAVLIALLIHLFLAQATRVEGYSMEPTLYGHQRLIIEKVSYRFHPPRRGDIVVIHVDGLGKEMLIKRVIGLPGERVEVKDGKVFINGQVLDEPYLDKAMRGQYPPTVVPEGYIFVMGDNRNNSNDSRSFGPVSLDDIAGRAWLRYWPISDFGLVH